MAEEVKKINLDIDNEDESLSYLNTPNDSSRISKISEGYTQGEDSEEEKYDSNGKRTPVKNKPSKTTSRRSSVEICAGFDAKIPRSPPNITEVTNPADESFKAENMLNEFEKQLNEQATDVSPLKKLDTYSPPAEDPDPSVHSQ